MPRSTKLITATYIVSFVAARYPEQVTSDLIAEKVREHPGRVRQLVSQLVKHKFLLAERGTNGGVRLGRPASSINVRQIYEAIKDQDVIALELKEPTSEWAGKCRVYPAFAAMFEEIEEEVLEKFAQLSVSELFTPVHPEAHVDSKSTGKVAAFKKGTVRAIAGAGDDPAARARPSAKKKVSRVVSQGAKRS